MNVTTDDLSDLAASRRAAAQIRQAKVIAEAQQVHLRGHRGPDGKMAITAAPLESEPFRSLAMSVRLVYQSNEPANFGHICNILARSGNEDVRTRTASLRQRYNATLNDHDLLTAIALADRDSYSPRDAFETWLYYGAFHQDRSRRADYEALAAIGDRFIVAVQSVALRLAGRTLDLDDVVADFLGEDRLPRIQPPEPAEQTPN